jgi:hypothetical protein
MSPSDKVAQLNPQALGSLSIASSDSQVYSGTIPNGPDKINIDEK